MLRKAGILCVAVLMVVATSDVNAQGRRQGGFGGGGFGGGGFDRGQSFAGLLRIQEVQDEIELSEAQKEELGDILTAPQRGFGQGGQRRPGGEDGQRRQRGQDGERPQRGERGERGEEDVLFQEGQPGRRGQNLTEEERAEFRERAAQQAREQEDKIAEVLEEAQLARLVGIYIQVSGTAALSHRWVAEPLELSGQQQEKITAAREEAAETMRAETRELFGGGNQGGDRDFNAIREKMQELRETADEAVYAILTDGQREKLEEMEGATFEMPERRFGGFGGGRPGGGEGGRPGADDGERPRRPQRPGSDAAF